MYKIMNKVYIVLQHGAIDYDDGAEIFEVYANIEDARKAMKEAFKCFMNNN